MQPDAIREATLDFFDLQHGGQELAEFEGAVRDVLVRGVLVDEVVVVLADHRRATAGRADDVLVVPKGVEEQLRDRAGIVHAAGVRHRLAAAGLARGEVDRAAEPLQQFECGDPNLRIKLVDVTGDEQPDVWHEATVFQWAEPEHNEAAGL